MSTGPGPASPWGPAAQPGLDFTAIDFETANGFRGSACAVGLVRVRDGRMAERAAWLMRPPAGFDRFDPRNTRIHGIRAEQVADAPRFAEVHERIAEFVGADVLVAHNAAFDVGVIESGLEVSGCDVPAYDYTCSLTLARRVYDLASYALPSAAREAGFTPGRHHDALADAEACAAILIDVAARTCAPGAASVDAVLAAQGMRRSTLPARAAGQGRESRATHQARLQPGLFDATVPLADERVLPDFMRWPDEGVNPEPAADADPAHPLYGQTVVFTGGIGMSRQEAKLRAAARGARTANRVNARTTVLVVGDGFSAADLAEAARRGTAQTVGAARSAASVDPGATRVSSALAHRKTREALARRARGQGLSLISEGEFLQMVDGREWGAAG